MRLVLRLVGTWLIAMAVILIVVDGIKSLSDGMIIMTPLGDTWAGLNQASLLAVRDFLATRFFGALLNPVLDTLLGWPGWAIAGVPGIILALMGRSRQSRLKQFTQI